MNSPVWVCSETPLCDAAGGERADLLKNIRLLFDAFPQFKGSVLHDDILEAINLRNLKVEEKTVRDLGMATREVKKLKEENLELRLWVRRNQDEIDRLREILG